MEKPYVINAVKPGITKEQMFELFELAEKRTKLGNDTEYDRSTIRNTIEFCLHNGKYSKGKKYYRIELFIGENERDYMRYGDTFSYITYEAAKEILNLKKVDATKIVKIIGKYNKPRTLVIPLT